MGLLISRVSALMMEAAGAVQDQDATGTPCSPKPRFAQSLMTINESVDLQLAGYAHCFPYGGQDSAL
jgi:hypothetical protein